MACTVNEDLQTTSKAEQKTLNKGEKNMSTGMSKEEIAKAKAEFEASLPGKTDHQIEGTIIHYGVFPSKLVEPRPVDVWLPEGYEESSEVRYPVIYMHDGQMMFDVNTSPLAGSDYFWEVDTIMSRLIREKKIRPAIVVSVWNLPDDKRRNEYMPQKMVNEEVAAVISAEGSDIALDDINSDNYLEFLLTELKPTIDQSYRTLADQPNTFIMGSSMGGQISAYAVSEYPEMFGGAACLSTHWTIGGNAVLEWYKTHWPKAGKNRVYFDYGTETLDAGYEPGQMLMDAVMRSYGYVEDVDWMTRKFEGADHSPRAWRERLHIPLQFLLGID